MSVVERVAREALACLGEAGRVLVPLACAGCDAPDVVLCGECSAELGLPVRLEQHAPALRSEVAVWGAGAYVGRRRRIVLAWRVTFPRPQAIDAVRSAILAALPEGVSAAA